MSKGERKVSKQEALQSQEREASKNKEGCQSGKEREVPKKGGEKICQRGTVRCQTWRERGVKASIHITALFLLSTPKWEEYCSYV